jgi:hypothetical protein
MRSTLNIVLLIELLCLLGCATVHTPQQSSTTPETLPIRLKSVGPLGKVEIIIVNDVAFKSLLEELAKFDPEINYDRINKYCVHRWNDVLEQAGLLTDDPSRPTLRAELKLMFGNWNTTYGPVYSVGKKISQGIFVRSALKITTSGRNSIMIEFSGGDVSPSASQWECLTQSVDVSLGYLLAAYARANVSSARCVALLAETLPEDKLENTLFEIGRDLGAWSIVPIFTRNDFWANEAAVKVLTKLRDLSAVEPLKALLNDGSIDWITRDQITELLNNLNVKK